MRFWHNQTEVTNKVKKYGVSNYNLNYLTDDALYIACDFPLNSLWIRTLIGANVSTDMKVEYWSNKWVEAVDLQDETLGLSSDGHIFFTPDKDSGWRMEDSDRVTGLNFTVYQKYWVKITFDSPFTASIDYVGYKFSEDFDLFSEYPIFDNADFLTAFKSGKTDWEEQAVTAGELIIQDLKRKNVIVGAEQILDKDLFLRASVSKVAELIYSSFGNDYVTKKEEARTEYSRRMDLKFFGVDQNNNAILENKEIGYMQNWLGR